MEKSEMKTVDPEMLSLIKAAEQMALSKSTVLITGESGTGKELLAQMIHKKSSRAVHRLIAVNCAALPEGLLESELFGYEKGAFTGAYQTKSGKFELAHESTLLLDEISELPLALQSKLLRVIQEGEVERLGARAPKKINVRIIATTNRDLAQMVKQGEFRQDLFYRLNVLPLRVPPLRLRVGDIEYLSKCFLHRLAVLHSCLPPVLTSSAIERLKAWKWPGNIRELENVIERSFMFNSGKVWEADQILIDYGLSDFQVAQSESSADFEGFSKLQKKQDTQVQAKNLRLSETEKRLIFKALQEAGNNKTHAALQLGISVRTLRNKLNKYKTENSNNSNSFKVECNLQQEECK